MSDTPTPVEGKGDEMIPNRGLPFEEEPFSDFEPETETAPAASLDDILDQIPADIAAPPPSETPSADTMPPDTFPAEPDPVDVSIPSEESPEESSLPVSGPLLNLDEIRAREQELAEDFHGPAPDFEGAQDDDFATARLPIPLPHADREAIMLESGAGIIPEDELSQPMPPEPEPEIPLTPAPVIIALEPEAPSVEESPEEFPSTPPAKITTEVTTETITSSQSDGTTAKESRTVKQEALFRDEIEMPGPASGAKVSKAPEIVRDLKASKKLLDLLIPNDRVEELWERADRLQQEVFQHINELSVAQDLLEQVRSAKNLILSDKANYEEAERALNEVEYRIIYSTRFKKWSFLGYLLLIYEIAFGAGAVYVLLLLLRAGETGLGLSGGALLSSGEVYIGIIAALFGCLGGVAGALFALWRYMTEERFNPQFSIWYVTQPIIGLTIGIVIYIIVKIGFNITAGNATAEVGSPLIPSLLAYLVGFQQNVFLDLAKQVFKQFKIGKAKEDGE